MKIKNKNLFDLNNDLKEGELIAPDPSDGNIGASQAPNNPGSIKDCC